MSYRMKTVENLTGLNRNTITTWERRYDILSPGRDESGYRVYTEEDVRRLRTVKQLLDDGYAIRDAIGAASRREGGSAPAPAPAPPPAPRSEPTDEGIEGLRGAMYDALLRFDRATADRLHARLIGTSYRVRLEEVYLPMLRQAGVDWVEGRVGVAQEHYVSGYCREHMISILQHLEQGPAGGPVAVCAGLPGEPHEIALMSVAVQLALRGFRVVWLGADLPLPDLVGAIREVEPDVVAHSVIQPHERGALEKWAQDLRRGIGPDPVIVFGGPGVRGVLTDVDGVLVCPTFADFVTAWGARS